MLVLAQGVCAKTVNIGNGSGYLNYPTAQTTLNLVAGDTLYINAGTYSGISIGNLAGSAGNPIIVQADANAVFTTTTNQNNQFPNVAYVTFRNFRYETYLARALQISGASHDLLFQDFHITGLGDYGFRIYDASKVFDGTKASAFYNFKWENMVVDGVTNGSVICNADYASVSNLKSLLLDFEIVGCSFSNLAGATLEMAKCFNLKLHDCTFSDITSLNHIACAYVSGYAWVYNNEFTRHWGDDVRMFPLKLNALGYNGSDAVSRYYNNISWEKTKYAAYEHNMISQADLDNSSGYYSRTSSEVYFNTLYRSRKADYVAPLVDCYGPNLTIEHNLIIEPECDATYDPNHNYVYALGGGQQTGLVVDNNLVYGTFAAAGLEDAVDFIPGASSPAKDASNGSVSYITVDHYGDGRLVGTASDIGAVERQATNVAPTVNAGTDQTMNYGTAANLDGTVTDDGLPNPPAAVTVTWSKTSGPGSVTFGNASAVDTAATFSASGTYVLRLTASDSSLQAYDEVTIVANAAPTVNAGNDQSILLPAQASLSGSASDDGLPNPPATVTVTWSKTSGPGTVTFGDANAMSTTATFSIAGTYVLRLTASDSVRSSYDEMQVTAANPTIVILSPVAWGNVNSYQFANAFNAQPTWGGAAPSGGDTSYNDFEAGWEGGNKVSYVDLGANWQKWRITQTWTKYCQWRPGSGHAYAQLWWDDDNDAVNDGTTETRVNFCTQTHDSSGPWLRDLDTTANPVVPQGRYLLLKQPASIPAADVTEAAFVGYLVP